MEIMSDECITIEQLHEKEVISITTGKRIGYPCDVKFDVCNGRITAIVIPQGGFFGKRCPDNDIVIPWCNIEKIGSDIILVKGECCTCECEEDAPKSKKKFLF